MAEPRAPRRPLYASFLVRRAIPDYRSVEGNIDVAILLRHDGEVTHFLTVTHWQSEEAIRAFAGDDLLKAKYYPEDEDFLWSSNRRCNTTWWPRRRMPAREADHSSGKISPGNSAFAETELPQIADTHGVEHAVQMVHLVLNDARMKSRHRAIDGVPFFVEA